MNRRTVNVLVGVGIPSGGTIIFNILTEMARGGAKTALSTSDFDFSFGCALAIVGFAVAQHDAQRARDIFVAFAALLLILLGSDIILRVQNPSREIWFVAFSDVVAMGAAVWAIWD